MEMKEHVKLFLSFSKKERRGIYILLFIGTLLWTLPLFFAEDGTPEDLLEVTPVQVARSKKILVARQDSIRYNRKYWPKYSHQYPIPARGSVPSAPYPLHESRARPYPLETKIVDLNEADSVALERLPGIGERLSARIIKYRDRLGGFHEIQQLKEVYGLRDSTFELLVARVMVAGRSSLKKIPINQCSYADLRKHPYMTHAFATSLLAYRDMHGAFKNEADLYKLATATKEMVDKMVPYFSFDE